MFNGFDLVEFAIVGKAFAKESHRFSCNFYTPHHLSRFNAIWQTLNVQETWQHKYIFSKPGIRRENIIYY